MIDELNPTGTVIAGSIHNRGFTAPATIAVTPPALPSLVYPVITHFWRGVITGTLMVMSLFVLSYLLMLGCHVGVSGGGYVLLGGGAAVWTVITAAIAFFIGGAMAVRLARPLAVHPSNLLPSSSCASMKGAAVWALAIPLTSSLWGAFGGINGLFPQLYLPHINVPQGVLGTGVSGMVYPGVPFGFIWTAVITLAVGLLCALIGSWAASMVEKAPPRP